MYKVDVYLRVRRAVMVEGMSMLEVSREFGVNGAEIMGHWGVEGQHKCPGRCSASMSLCYGATVSDDDAVRTGRERRRPGGPSASMYFLMVALWIPNSLSIARSDIPLRMAF